MPIASCLTPSPYVPAEPQEGLKLEELAQMDAGRGLFGNFSSHLATWLRTRRFGETIYFSTLRSHKSLEKHSVSRLFYLFAHLDLLASETSETFSFVIFFLLLFYSLTLHPSAFPSRKFDF